MLKVNLRARCIRNMTSPRQCIFILALSNNGLSDKIAKLGKNTIGVIDFTGFMTLDITIKTEQTINIGIKIK